MKKADNCSVNEPECGGGCGHCHTPEPQEGGDQLRIARLIAGGVLLGAAFLPPVSELLRLVLFCAAFLLVGGAVLFRALKNIGRGKIFDENFLMSVAGIGAFAMGDHPEAVAVMLFYQVGEYFQSRAVNRSRRSIRELMDLRPDHALVLIGDKPVETPAQEVMVGTTILVRPGEKIPLDGVVLEGDSWLDTSALTGESQPRQAQAGSPVLSGFVNRSGTLKIIVSKAFEDSTASRILQLVEQSGANKAEAEQFITKFARVYTPAVVSIAAVIAIIPPLLFGGEWFGFIHRALIFLVVSCPCALVISIPMGYFAGIGRASRHGILIKGGNYLEALCKAEIAVLDKTGTLTRGSFEVVKLVAAGAVEYDLLELAALAECYSTHPVAASIVSAYGKEPDRSRIAEYTELSGKGVKVLIDGKTIYAGNARLMADLGIPAAPEDPSATVVYLAAEGQSVGSIYLMDTLKQDAPEAIRALKTLGIRKTVMLSGDREEVARKIGTEAGIDEIYAEQLPDGKVAQVELLLNSLSANGTLLFIGDGINDAPALRRADVGIAMGAIGSDAAMEAADVVIMTDELSQIARAIRISRITRKIVTENIVFAIGVKLIILTLGALGFASMWSAVFADVGVSLLAILNSMRILRAKLP